MRVPASGSTITVCTLGSVSLAREVSSRNSDSGVVIGMSGGPPACRRLPERVTAWPGDGFPGQAVVAAAGM